MLLSNTRGLMDNFTTRRHILLRFYRLTSLLFEHQVKNKFQSPVAGFQSATSVSLAHESTGKFKNSVSRKRVRDDFHKTLFVNYELLRCQSHVQQDQAEILTLPHISHHPSGCTSLPRLSWLIHPLPPCHPQFSVENNLQNLPDGSHRDLPPGNANHIQPQEAFEISAKLKPAIVANFSSDRSICVVLVEFSANSSIEFRGSLIIRNLPDLVVVARSPCESKSQRKP